MIIVDFFKAVGVIIAFAAAFLLFQILKIVAVLVIATSFITYAIYDARERKKLLKAKADIGSRDSK